MARTKAVPTQTNAIQLSPEEESEFDDAPIATIRSVPSRTSLPRILKFPLVVLINFSLTILLNTILVEFTGPQLYPVARDLREDWQIGVVAGWKVLELGLAWFAGFDGMFCPQPRNTVPFVLHLYISHHSRFRQLPLTATHRPRCPSIHAPNPRSPLIPPPQLLPRPINTLHRLPPLRSPRNSPPLPASLPTKPAPSRSKLEDPPRFNPQLCHIHRAIFVPVDLIL